MSEACYKGGAQALENNNAVLESLLDAKTFQAQRKIAKEHNDGLLDSLPVITKDNVHKVFADAMAREGYLGGNPEFYESALRNLDVTDDASFAAIRSVMLNQYIYTQGMKLSATKMVGFAEQITNAKRLGTKEVDIKNLELEMVSAQAQLQNYKAHRSSLGSGLSFAFAQRAKKNAGKTQDIFDSYVDSYVKNYKDAFEGEEFLQGLERNSKTRKVLDDEIKAMSKDADMSPHVQAAKDAVTETQADLASYIRGKDAELEKGLTADMEAGKELGELLRSESEFGGGFKKGKETEKARAGVLASRLFGLPEDALTHVRTGNSFVFFNKGDQSFYKFHAADPAETLGKQAEELKKIREANPDLVSDTVFIPLRDEAGNVIAYGSKQRPAGVEVSQIVGKTDKDKKLLLELLESNPLYTKRLVETDSGGKNIGAVLDEDGMVRAEAFDFDGLEGFNLSKVDIDELKNAEVARVPLKDFSEAAQRSIKKGNESRQAGTVNKTEVDLKSKVKSAKEDVTQLTRLKELQDKVKAEEMDSKAIQAEIDNLKPAKGKSLSNLQTKLAKLKKKEGATEDEIADLTKQVEEAKANVTEVKNLEKRLANLKNNNKDIAKVEAEIEQLKGKVDKIKELKKLEQTLARLKKPKSDIKKTKEQLEQIKKAREEAARRKVEASEITTEAQYKKFINQTLGSRDARTFAKRLTFADKMGKADTVISASKKTGFRKMLDAGLQWFTGSLLSGPPTFVLNAATPILSRTLQQLELATGALMSGNIPLFRASIDMHHLFYGVKDAWDMAGASLKMDKDALLGGQRVFDDAGEEMGAFASANFKNVFLSTEPMATVMDTLNFITRLPNRINGSVDSFNKTLASMKYLRTHYTSEALAKKMPHHEIEEYVRLNVRKMFNNDGSLYSEARLMQSAVKQANEEGLSKVDAVKFQQRVAEIMETSIKNIGMKKTDADTLSRTTEKFARESTFTDEPGTYTKLIKQGLDHMPVFKFIMPFVSTPMNILHFGWRRTLPGALIDKMSPVLRKTAEKRKDDWAKLTPMEQAAARGRYATAVATSGAMIYFASQHGDHITGGGPRNRQERKALMATGWRPYSFVTHGDDGTKTYVSYERVDPLATMIAIIADGAEFTKMNPDDDDGFAEVFSALSFTIAENMTDKSFLRGVNNILNITREPEVYLPKTLKDITAGFVPMFIDKLKTANGEQMIRETRTLKDAIWRKVPIAEEKIPPKRTFLGEAVYKQNPGGVLAMLNPIYIQSTKNDLVDEKIQGLLYGFSMPEHNWTKSKETDMREFNNPDGRQAYDRMLELTSEHKIYGRTLRQSLKALFKSPAYKQAEQNFQQFGSSEGDTDPRVRLAKRVISRYRRVAKRLVIQEFPELQQAVRQAQQRNYQLRTGQSLNPIPSL